MFPLSFTLVTNSSQPLEAELAALSVASRSGDSDGNFVIDPSSIELLQTHARQQCGRLGKKFPFLLIISRDNEELQRSFRHGILKLIKQPTPTKIARWSVFLNSRF